MSIVGCLYLCLDMFLKGRLFPDKAQFNKEIFHCRVDEHLHIFPSASGLSLCCTQSLSISCSCFSLLLSNPSSLVPTSLSLIHMAILILFSFTEVSKHLHVVGIYFRNMYTQCKLKKLKSLKYDLSSYLRRFSLCLTLPCFKNSLIGYLNMFW